jgi:hypothetical protein
VKRRTTPKQTEWEIVLDLEQIDPNITGEDLIEMGSRAKAYNKAMTRSGLSDAGWCNAMSISEERHKSYKQMSCKVPNSVLNKALHVQRQVLAFITRLHNEGI